MLFLKEHLIGKYNWPENTRLVLHGAPARRLFDRWNGYQVLFIINCLAALSENFSIADAADVENMIINNLSTNTQSEITVFNWLRSEPVMV